MRSPVSRAQSLHALAIWSAAVLVGLAAVVYARLIDWTQRGFHRCFEAEPLLTCVATPVLFVGATGLVRWFAPDAKGSGIPQVLVAIQDGKNESADSPAWQSSLVSLRTAAIKVVSSLAGILAGASIGREGPTVQIAASVFAALGRWTRRLGGPLAAKVKLSTFLTAGAAAGVAAAFNTPLAGITFAIEEILDGALATFKQPMMVAVILGGITAQAFLGNYLYFGHPEVGTPDLLGSIGQAALIGLAGGLAGGAFAKLLAEPGIARLPQNWVLRSTLCGIACAALAYGTEGATAGSGYEVTARALEGATLDSVRIGFPIEKALSTSLSYLSGMAGGIFSPSLSIGAGIGLSIAKLFHFAQFKSCALIGMVAFFSGVVQAPLTAVIIVTEMTDQHILILPFMIAAFIGQGLGRWFLPHPLYHTLAKRHLEG